MVFEENDSYWRWEKNSDKVLGKDKNNSFENIWLKMNLGGGARGRQMEDQLLPL